MEKNSYNPSNEILGQIRISVNPRCVQDGSTWRVLGNWLSLTERMSEVDAINLAKRLVKNGVAVIVAPQYTSNNEGIPNPSPSGKVCFWEWRSFNGGDFEFVLFEFGSW